MKTRKKYQPYNEQLQNGVFVAVILAAIFLAFQVKGLVLGGLFVGIVSTIAIWVLVLKLPSRLKIFMGDHQLFSDVALTALAGSAMAVIGPGITMFIAMSTQAVLQSVLLKTLKI